MINLKTLFESRSLDQRFPSIATMEAAARRRTPKFAWDYMAGGIGQEKGVAANVSAFDAVKFMPRYLTSIPFPDLRTTILGQDVSAPFGPGPVGLSGLIWPDAPVHIARGAAAHGMACGLSSVATASIEDVAPIMGDRLWFQLYPMHNPDVEADILRRFREAGGEVLLITVDVPGPTRRARDIGNGLAVPPKLTWRTYMQGAMRPSWAVETLRKGLPTFRTIERYGLEDGKPEQTSQFLSTLLGGHNPIERLRRYRDLWPGKMVIKGVLGLDDARTALEVGADGIIVSNHGGRQLDAAPTAVEVLPTIRQAVGGKMTVLVDGGVRTGLDIAKYLALGADFVLLGRPLVYSVAAIGGEGPNHALHVLKTELATTLNQIGCEDYRELASFIYRD